MGTVYSNEELLEVEMLIKIRRAISSDDNQKNIQIILDSNVQLRLIRHLDREGEDYLKMASAWVISNLSSGSSSQCRELMNAGAMAVLVRQLGRGEFLLIR